MWGSGWLAFRHVCYTKNQWAGWRSFSQAPVRSLCAADCGTKQQQTEFARQLNHIPPLKHRCYSCADAMQRGALLRVQAQQTQALDHSLSQGESNRLQP